MKVTHLMTEVISYETIPETLMGLKLLITKEDMAGFKELIQRGAQTWADAPPAMKELADLITNGEVLQNYWPDAKPEVPLQVIDMAAVATQSVAFRVAAGLSSAEQADRAEQLRLAPSAGRQEQPAP